MARGSAAIAFVWGLALAIGGCGGDPAPGTDAGGGLDAGAGGDSGARDAGVAPDDGGPRADAGVAADAATPDAGVGGDAGQCVDDSREEDDTIAAAMASPTIYSLTGSTTLDGLVSCPGDDDYYSAHSDCCGDAYGAELRWAPADGSLELSVVDASGAALPMNVDETTAGNRRLLQTSPAASADFFVRVHDTGSTSVPYTLVVYALVFGP